MLNPNIEQKLLRTVKDLEFYSELEEQVLTEVFLSTDVDLSNLNVLPSDNIKWEKMLNPHVFRDPFTYYWIKCSFDVPEKKVHQKTYLCLDTKITNVASTIRPQGLLYLNGKIVQGIDINHKDVLLEPGHYDMMMLFYSHDVKQPFPLYMSINTVDARTEKAYWDFFIPTQSFVLLDQKDENYFKMSPVLEKACNEIDFRIPLSEQFYLSLEKACDYLYKHFYNGICGNDIKVNILGHSHIDVAWLWDYAQTREKVKRTFSTVLKLMDEYPEYKFMASTPQLYEFIKEDAPDLYEQIKQKVKEGRWEIEGALWLECDCNLTSGESLVRQIVHGKRFIKEEFDIDSKVVWLPDVFGYSGALPQIMRKAGVDSFVTAKIGWNDTNRFPYDTFIWKGIDGSSVDAYLISTPGECSPRKGIYDVTYTTYCPEVTADTLLGTWHRYTQKEFNRTVFMTMGFGDGGGGVTREMLESQRRFAYGIPGIPTTVPSTLKETIEEIKHNFETSCLELRRTPTWTGELYFEYHRGTLTSVPMVKKYNRDSELLLQKTEAVSKINNILFNTASQKEILNSNWKKALLNQFHDVLPGSSIEKVYQDAKEIYESLFNEIKPIFENSVKTLLNNVKGQGVAVYNPNGFTATGNISINNKTYVVNDIPSFGYKVINLEEKENNLTVKDKYLRNDYYEIKFNDDGSISSLLDLINNRQLVKEGDAINKLVAYEDMAYEYDNWELAPFYKHKPYPLNDKATFTIIKDNERVGLQIVKAYNNSTITQNVYIYEGLKRIDVENDIVWNEKNQILKALFPINLLVDDVNYDIQFGHVKRNAHHNNSHDSACFECVAHKWLDASENNYGFALLNNGKYGFGTYENELSISLIKSGSFPYDGASEISPKFTYSLLPHSGSLTSSDVINEAYVLNNPLEALVINNSEGILPSEYSFVKCSTPGVCVETIKEAYDSDATIVRMYEAYKERKMVTLEFGIDIKEVNVVDLLENKIKTLNVNDNKVSFEIQPFEIITLMVK